jgi:hypothetical protein
MRDWRMLPLRGCIVDLALVVYDCTHHPYHGLFPIDECITNEKEHHEETQVGYPRPRECHNGVCLRGL